MSENSPNHSVKNNNNKNTGNPSQRRDEDTMSTRRGFSTIIPPEASYENVSKVVELDDDGNELGELPRMPSRYVSTPPRRNVQSDNSLPYPGSEEEQICLASETSNDIDGGYLEPQNHIYQEIKEVKKTVEVTPTGSRIFTVEEKTTKIPLLQRLTSRRSRKSSNGDLDTIKCTCSKQMLIFAVTILVLLAVLISVAVVLVVKRRDSQPERRKI